MNNINLDVERNRYQLRKAAGAYWLIDMEQDESNYKKPLQLNETGADIWIMYEQGKTCGEIVKELAVQYGADEDELKTDIADFMKMLQSHIH